MSCSFERGGPTEEIWYYEQPLPPDRKNYTKTQPLQYEEFADCISWWNKRVENERAWKVPVGHVLKYHADGRLASVNLDEKNPNGKADLEHLPAERLIDDIVAKGRLIVKKLEALRAELAEEQRAN
jgi:type I restriction enzyme M protein